MLPPTERFSDRVHDYVKYRPSYPREVIDLIALDSNLNEQSLIADVGCGTGIFAKILLESPASVIGVEPNQAMLDAAVKYLGLGNRFFPILKPAEQTGILANTIDAITAAQAFHWFDPVQVFEEFQRILKPNGKVYLVWNERKSTGSKFAKLYEAVLIECSPEYAKVTHRNRPDKDILGWFQNPNATMKRFKNTQRVDLESFLGRAYSSSYVPPVGTPEREVITKRLVEVFDQCHQDGLIELEYDTKVFFGEVGPIGA